VWNLDLHYLLFGLHVPELDLAGGDVAEAAGGHDRPEWVVVDLVAVVLIHRPDDIALEVEDGHLDYRVEIKRRKTALTFDGMYP
jgi:hypothetical protein